MSHSPFVLQTKARGIRRKLWGMGSVKLLEGLDSLLRGIPSDHLTAEDPLNGCAGVLQDRRVRLHSVQTADQSFGVR